MNTRRTSNRISGLTLVEVLVVVFVLAVLVVVILPALTKAKTHNGSNCVSNLKQIGLACRIWAGDNNDKYPAQVSVTNGGAMELAVTGDAAGIFCVMSNELGSPRILYCPADQDRVAATNFTTDFNNSKISYFVGLDADLSHPQMILSGDDNFAIGGVPVKSGLLEIITNTPITWTTARHKSAGNIGLADGSVQQVTTDGLQNALHLTSVATNRFAIP